MTRIDLATARIPSVVVAASNAPDSVKRFADYVCNGNNDQVEINQALEDAQVGFLVGGVAGGEVLLSAGTFNINSPILMRSRTRLSGSGWGTQLEPTTGNTQSVVALGDGNSSYMTELHNLAIHGRARSAHGIHYVQSVSGTPDMAAPDALHRISHVMVFRCGSSGAPRDGIYLEGTGSGGGRGTQIEFCRVRQIWRHGIRVDGFSDCKISKTSVNTNDDGGGHGVIVGGGNCEISDTKSWYTAQDAFHIPSSRAQLVNCVAQDAGRHGFYLANSTGTTITGGQADSCGRLSSGDGYHLAGNGHIITGVRSSDRNQTPSSPQRHGFNFVSGQRHFVSGVAQSNAVSDVNGTPGANSYVRIVRTDGPLFTAG